MYVYILRSKSNISKTYVGLSNDFKRRLREHNRGESKYTSKYIPWKLETVHWFSDKQKAYNFERYLKTASGIAFRNKRF